MERRPVHLADAAGGERRWAKVQEDVLGLLLELLEEDLTRHRRRHRGDVRLQHLEVRRNVGRDRALEVTAHLPQLQHHAFALTEEAGDHGGDLGVGADFVLVARVPRLKDCASACPSPSGRRSARRAATNR